MGVVLDTPLVHKSFSDVINKITPGAHIYDNPNQQGTKLPAWFIVHRDPVTITRDLDKRAWLTYGIDLYYMLELNMPRTFDSYSAVADALNTELKYLTIYGTQFKTHVIDRSWQLKLDCLCYSTTLKFRVSETEEPETKMQVIEDLAVFLKNQPPEPPFYDIAVEPSENGHVETDRDKAQKGRVVTVTPYPDKDYMLQTIRVMCGARNIPVTDNSFIMPDGPVSIYSEFVEAPVAVLWRFFDDREPEPIMGYRYIHNLSKAKPIDHGEAHVLDVSTSVFSKGKPIDHCEVEVITPEMMPMMAARMIDHGSVSVLDVELDRMLDNVSISYLNADKSQSRLTPSYSYNWLLYDYNGSAQTADSNATYTLKPAIVGLYLLVDAGRLYLNGTPTREITLSKVSYTVEQLVHKAWLNADHTIKSFISEMEWYDLYDDNGQYITSGFPDPFTSHSFTLVNAYRGDSVVPCTFNQFGISTGHLKVNMGVDGQSVQYITYMETPTT